MPAHLALGTMPPGDDADVSAMTRNLAARTDSEPLGCRRGPSAARWQTWVRR
jgi:hypothetical protein